MSVQQQEKTTHKSRREAYQPNSSNTSSRVRLRSCLRGEIEDAECKKLKIEIFFRQYEIETLEFILKLETKFVCVSSMHHAYGFFVETLSEFTVRKCRQYS